MLGKNQIGSIPSQFNLISKNSLKRIPCIISLKNNYFALNSFQELFAQFLRIIKIEISTVIIKMPLFYTCSARGRTNQLGGSKSSGGPGKGNVNSGEAS